MNAKELETYIREKQRQGLSEQQIATSLGISVGDLRVRLMAEKATDIQEKEAAENAPETRVEASGELMAEDVQEPAEVDITTAEEPRKPVEAPMRRPRKRRGDR